jgi:hypothetical protein
MKLEGIVLALTTLSAANAAARGIRALVETSLEVSPLQTLHLEKNRATIVISGRLNPRRQSSAGFSLRDFDFIFAGIGRGLKPTLLDFNAEITEGAAEARVRGRSGRTFFQKYEV